MTYPILSFSLVRKAKNRPLLKKRLIIITLILTVLSILGAVTHISTTVKTIDWVLMTSVYFSICLFLWLGYFQKYRALKVLAIIGMICIYSVGYLLGTVGALGMGFAISEFDTDTEQWIGNGYIYKETALGNAISDYRGKRVEIYRTIPWFPVLEWRITQKEYFNVIPYRNKLKVDYRPDRQTIYLSTSEYDKLNKKRKTWSDTLKIEQRN